MKETKYRNSREGLNWLGSLFGGGIGKTIEAKKKRKKKIESTKKKNGY